MAEKGVLEAAQKHPMQKRCILIADDDFFMRGQAKIALQGLGEIIEAESGDQVLSLYKEHSPAVVLLDIHMPKQGGKAVLAEILSHDPKAHVVIFSADANEKNVVGLKASGARGFVAKPFTKPDLLKYVMACPAFDRRSQASGDRSPGSSAGSS